MPQRSSSVLIWHPANHLALLLTLSRNLAPPTTRLIRTCLYIGLLQGLYSISHLLNLTYHIQFNKFVFTCMHLARNTYLLSRTLCDIFRVQYSLDYIYHHPMSHNLSPTLTLIVEYVQTQDIPHLDTVSF